MSCHGLDDCSLWVAPIKSFRVCFSFGLMVSLVASCRRCLPVHDWARLWPVMARGDLSSSLG
ncbi:unnamed protein product [Arabis nemorensis]|uniref:Uncharacterized protein n=1 Tax=Arabis nemorensis TaxID=586526 RepID=A0A565CH63_9BRAS|nr:unnamed protein product [Arabis nemorensis]